MPGFSAHMVLIGVALALTIHYTDESEDSNFEICTETSLLHAS